MLDLHLPPGPFAVLCALLLKDYQRGRNFESIGGMGPLECSYATLAKLANVSPRTAIRAVAKLQAHELISVEPQGDRVVNRYEIDKCLIHSPGTDGTPVLPLIKVPRILIGRLKPVELLTWVSLKSFEGRGGIYPGVRKIAASSGLSTATLEGWWRDPATKLRRSWGSLERLQRRGLVVVEPGTGGHTSRYTLTSERSLRAVLSAASEVKRAVA